MTKRNQANNFLCLNNEFLCKVEMKCIPLELQCNGEADCEDGSDEVGPMCKNGSLVDRVSKENVNACVKEAQQLNSAIVACHDQQQCIPKDRWCDRVVDCQDRSDEMLCIDLLRTRCDPEKEFPCNAESSICVPLASVCNSRRDCPDGRDERHGSESKMNCSTNPCAQNNGGCPHICVNYFGEPRCLCRTGYSLSTTTSQCEDVNECTKWGTCPQICENLPGSYRCSCQRGYSYNKDYNSCQPHVPNPLALLYETQRDLRFFSLMTRHLSVLYKIPREANILAIDYQLSGRNLTVFLAERHADEHDCLISVKVRDRSSHTKATNEVETLLQLEEGHHIRAMSFDSVNHRLYWATEEDIFVLDTDAPQWWVCLLHAPNLGSALLAVPIINKLYFIELDHGVLMEANLDGTGVQEVKQLEDAEFVRNFNWDYALGRLVWLDTSKRVIHSYHSPSKEDIPVILNQIPWMDPSALTVLNEDYLWVDASDGAIHSLFKFTNGSKQPVLIREAGKAHAKHLQAVHPYNRPDGPRTCSRDSCEQLCLPSAIHQKERNIRYQIKCFCHHGYRLDVKDNRSCIATSQESQRTKTPTHQPYHELISSRSQRQLKKPPGSLIVLLVSLIAGMTLFLMLFACFYWRERIGLLPTTIRRLSEGALRQPSEDKIKVVRYSSAGDQGSTEDLHYDNPVYAVPVHQRVQQPFVQHEIRSGERSIYEELQEVEEMQPNEFYATIGYASTFKNKTGDEEPLL